MKKSRKWISLVLVLALLTLGGGAALASAGGANDPLVTLSYLQQKFLPQLLQKVGEQTASRQTALSKDLSDQIEKYKQESGGGSGGGTGTGDGGYTLLALTTGKTVHLDVGCEILLRVGSARINANTSPALIDLSTGGTINNGASLTKNHLYMATIPDRTLSPTAQDTKILIRGGYSVT